MYLKSRVSAGKQLASRLKHYKGQPSVVVALSDGGVVVGAQIAKSLKCAMTMLLIEPIKVPGEPEAIAVINQDGQYTYNRMYSTGQLEAFDMEYHGYIEQAKLQKMHKMHRAYGISGLIDKSLLRDRNIILVSDGLSNAFSLDAAIEYLKPVSIRRLIIATPLATINATDRMHVETDEIQCLSVVNNYISTDHYYDDNKIPSHMKIVRYIQNFMASKTEK